MAAVACPSCGTQVRADAAACPTCGHRLRHEPGWKATELGGVLAIAAGLAVATIGSLFGSRAGLFVGLGLIGLGVATYAVGWLMARWRRG